MTTSTPTRFVALDVHRKYVVVGAVDAGQQVVLSPRRFGFEAFNAWAPTHLMLSDVVVLEATANAWLLYDQLKPFVTDVLVAHPQAVKLISAARVKTDSRDTIKLASLLAANLIPASLRSSSSRSGTACSDRSPQATCSAADPGGKPSSWGSAPSQFGPAPRQAFCCAPA